VSDMSEKKWNKKRSDVEMSFLVSTYHISINHQYSISICTNEQLAKLFLAPTGSSENVFCTFLAIYLSHDFTRYREPQHSDCLHIW